MWRILGTGLRRTLGTMARWIARRIASWHQSMGGDPKKDGRQSSWWVLRRSRLGDRPLHSFGKCVCVCGCMRAGGGRGSDLQNSEQDCAFHARDASIRTQHLVRHPLRVVSPCACARVRGRACACGRMHNGLGALALRAICQSSPLQRGFHHLAYHQGNLVHERFLPRRLQFRRWARGLGTRASCAT